MNHYSPPIPREFAKWQHAAHVIAPRPTADELAVRQAQRRYYALGGHHQNSNLSGTWSEIIFANVADYTAKASFTTEASLLEGGSGRHFFPAGFFNYGRAKMARIEAWGIAACTGTPTYTFSVRLGTSSTWSASDTSVASSTAITMQSGVSNQHWYLQALLLCTSPGIGTGGLTLQAQGFVHSPGGFAAPYMYALAPSIGSPATWTTTIDGSLPQYIGLSVACSASSASNTITCKRLIISGLN